MKEKILNPTICREFYAFAGQHNHGCSHNIACNQYHSESWNWWKRVVFFFSYLCPGRSVHSSLSLLPLVSGLESQTLCLAPCPQHSIIKIVSSESSLQNAAGENNPKKKRAWEQLANPIVHVWLGSEASLLHLSIPAYRLEAEMLKTGNIFYLCRLPHNLHFVTAGF